MADLAETFRKIINFLKKNNFDYLIIGGIASAALGYPRLTQDIDICIFIKRKKVKEFLKKVKIAGFFLMKKLS